MTADDQEYGSADAGEVAALTALLAQALHLTPALMQDWLERLSTTNLRVVRRRGQVVAGLGIIPMGQWFGGARVPVAAITAVGVAPEQRNRGVGLGLLRGLLAELHGSGTPLAALYPSTLSFYRRAGFERAGTRITYELPTHAIPSHESALELERVAPGSFTPLIPLYNQIAPRTPGMFDRAPFIWQNIVAPSWTEATSYLITRDGQPEGYLVLTQGARHEPLRIRDLVLLSHAAGQRALSFLAGHRVFIDHVHWIGGPGDALIALLPEQRYKLIETFDWVLRIVDLPAALSQRGYPRSLRAELDLEVQDDLLAANSGRWQITIMNGRAQVRQGGVGRVQLGIRELAALYSGHLTPDTLQLSGALSGPADDLALLALLWSGPSPRLTDPF